MPYAGAIYYEEHGSGPPLILSSGLGGSAKYWGPNIPALAEHFRVIVYDHAGTGRCSVVNLPPQYRPTIDDMSDDVARLMDAAGIEKAHFVGHALGGLIGLALARRAPQRLDRMVAINSWVTADPLTLTCFDARLTILARTEWRQYARITPIFLYPPQWMADNAERLRHETAEQADDQPNVTTLMARIDAVRAFDATSWIDELVTPTLALGARDDMLVPYTASQRLAGANRAFSLALMDWGGHACNVTDPDTFNRLVLDFLGEMTMQIGVFVPINNNGWLISENAPQYMPSFDLNKRIAQSAERYGLDFLLSMIKLRGFGGKTEFWEYGLESFTLMAGLAAVTEKIKIYATCPTLVIPPAFAARMCNTIDSISHGRFGLNLITGWQRPEYSQMGLWPGDEHFRNRYQMLGEYARILRECWETGRSDFKGDYYQMDDCLVRPKPEGDMKIICAGSSDEGLAFSAQWADYAFCLGKGVNTPTAFASNNDRLAAATARTGREVSVFVLVMIIAAETDEEAMARWQHINAGLDYDAVRWLIDQGAADKHNPTTNVRQLAAPEGAVNINMGTLVGSYESVARMLDEMSEVPNTGGVLLTFDDFVQGVEDFGTRIQPLMKSRSHIG